MHTHPRHPSGAGQTAGVWDFVIIHYTKYELAYPCGNDANTGRCCRYNSILSLKKKIVWLHPLVPHWYKRMKPRENRIRKFIFSVGSFCSRPADPLIQTIVLSSVPVQPGSRSTGSATYTQRGTKEKDIGSDRQRARKSSSLRGRERECLLGGKPNIFSATSWRKGLRQQRRRRQRKRRKACLHSLRRGIFVPERILRLGQSVGSVSKRSALTAAAGPAAWLRKCKRAPVGNLCLRSCAGIASPPSANTRRSRHGHVSLPMQMC